MIRLLLSGGPGSGCTSTAEAVGKLLGVPFFDSDAYFHKPTDPPFQEQFSFEERRTLLSANLEGSSDWIVSGSIATWEVTCRKPTHGVLLNIPCNTRMTRLL